MDFIVDTNLPPSLAAWLVSQGLEAKHTRELGLEQATDRAIWRNAKSTNACIITKDEDSIWLKTADPSGPPVVWVRIGNAVKLLQYRP